MVRAFSVKCDELLKSADELSEISSNMTTLIRGIGSVSDDLQNELSNYQGVIEALDVCRKNIRKNQKAVLSCSRVCRISAISYSHTEENIVANIEDGESAFVTNTWRKLTDRILYFRSLFDSPDDTAYEKPSQGIIRTGLLLLLLMNCGDSTGNSKEKYNKSGSISRQREIFGKDSNLDGEYSINGDKDIENGDIGLRVKGKLNYYLSLSKNSWKEGLISVETEERVNNIYVTGGIGATLISHGKFSPDVYSNIHARGSIYEKTDTRTVGTEQVNGQIRSVVSLIGGENANEVKFGKIVDEETGKEKYGLEFGFGKEAYLVRGEVTRRIDLWGIEIEVSDSDRWGAGTVVKGEISTAAIEFDPGQLIPNVGRVRIDWSNFEAPW